MVNNWFHIIYIAVISALLVLLGVSLSSPDKVVEVTKHLTDSIVVTKHDTLTITKVVEVEKKVVDTVYVKSENNSIPIPISEYRFFKPNEYDITAKGFNVTMPSITIFPKTITTTITNTIERNVTLEKCAIYGGFGMTTFNGRFAPEASISFATPQRWLFSAKIGHFEGMTYYGGTIQYKLTR